MTTFIGNLITSVEKFHIFVIAGKLSRNADELTIKFKSSTNAEADVPLEILLNLKENNVLLNAFKYRQQNDDEQRICEFRHSGGNFKVYVTTCDEKFHIVINDDSLKSAYQYVLPLKSIKAISVEGDVAEIYRVDHRRSLPTPLPNIQDDAHIYDFSADVPQCYRPGDKVIMNVIPHGDFRIFMVDYPSQLQRLCVHGRFQSSDGVVDVTSMNENSE